MDNFEAFMNGIKKLHSCCHFLSDYKWTLIGYEMDELWHELLGDWRLVAFSLTEMNWLLSYDALESLHNLILYLGNRL